MITVLNDTMTYPLSSVQIRGRRTALRYVMVRGLRGCSIHSAERGISFEGGERECGEHIQDTCSHEPWGTVEGGTRV